MADQETQSSRAEQRQLAVAKLKRAASLPRMKDGRRPPMHVEFVSEGEKVASEDDKGPSEASSLKMGHGESTPEPILSSEDVTDTPEANVSSPSPPALPPQPPSEQQGDGDLDADTELELGERPTSPSVTTKKRRSRSRSRSRTSRDMKVKARGTQSPTPQLGGDSSQDENQPLPSPPMVPIIPTLVAPIPSHFHFLQQQRLLRSPPPLSPDMGFFYPGTSPPTPFAPSLEQIQKGVFRSNSAGSAARNHQRALAKLTGGKDTYDLSPSPTPPPFASSLSRNNTVSGGERIAARQNLLNRLGPRLGKETADVDATNGADDRGTGAGNQAKRRRRRSRRTSQGANTAPAFSDSEFYPEANTPALPPTPLPMFHDHFGGLRAMSTTPNQLSSSGSHSRERLVTMTPPPPPVPPKHGEEEQHARRRSVVIEEPDDEDASQTYPRFPPGTPQRSYSRLDTLRAPHSSDAPSNGSSDSGGGVGVPVFLSQRAPSRNEPFPSSPFTTPLKEKGLSDNEEEEQVLYPATSIRPRTPYGHVVENYDREISWVATEVPRMPIHDDEDEGDEDEDDQAEQDANLLQHQRVEVIEVEVHEEEEAPQSTASSSQEAFDDTSPRASTSSKSILVESETSPENGHSYGPPSPSSPAPISQPPFSDGSISPQLYPTRLSIASRIQASEDRSPITGEFPEWDDRYVNNDMSKRAETTSPTTWEKVKNMVRSGSSAGRRSRTNSILTRERRDQTDSSVSRESGASLTSAKTDKGDSFSAQVQAPPLMQSPSASASILSLSPHAPARGNSISPIPPATAADKLKYQSSKLNPFPGIIKLEEERRLRGLPASSPSNPDVSFRSNAADDASPSPINYSFSNTPMQSPEIRERKLSHQNSDSRLVVKPDSGSPFAPQYPDYIDAGPHASQSNSYSLKLPMTLPGVKQWLSKNSKKKATPTSSATSTGSSVSFASTTAGDSTTITNKKPSLSDIFGKKEGELSTDWEDVSTPPTTNNDVTPPNNLGPAPPVNGVQQNGSAKANHMDPFESHTTPKIPTVVPLNLGQTKESSDRLLEESSLNTRLTSPDPSASSDYPAPTPSSSSSTSSSQYSLGVSGTQGAALLERLEDNLTRNSRSPNLSAVVDDPPRKLVLSSPVLQVVNPNTVKDRFLLLFNDLLVIAKPVNWDQDNMMDSYSSKVSIPDRKYAVKSVVPLRNLRFTPERSETKGVNCNSRSPLLREFIAQFSENPDQAITTLFSRSSLPNDPVFLGQILFRAVELDRALLGEYLVRRTSKTVLKSYLDSFGFANIKIHVALRIFLHSIHVPRQTPALDYLLDSFASRWYEVNAKLVAYDKDMAIRLVRALVQLNDLLHGGIADEPGPTDHNRRNVASKDFQDAFRRYDPRYLVPEDHLSELYRSLFRERLCQATSPSLGLSDILVTVKRLLPARLTLKSQSEPIVIRLPQPDPLFSIELYGQDLTFDPPVLHFSKSSEVSFRVMGTSLGTKTVIMCRAGPNATKYSGLPQSTPIAVERSFMRNTFQLAFLDQEGEKKRYMFSVDDPIIRNEWVTSLKRHIDAANAATAALASPPVSPKVVKFQKAVETIAFKVLQDTLLGKTKAPATANGHHPNGSYSSQNGGGGPLQFSFPSGAFHMKSRSQGMAYRFPPDRHGLDRSQNSSRESNDEERREPSPMDGILWTSRELELQCQQNSSIPMVLSYLQTRPSPVE